MEILLTSNEEKFLRGSAFAVAGLVKGLGMKTLKEKNIFEDI